MVLVLFFVMVAVIVPFAIGPDRPQLMRLAPGIVWIAAFLSMLLGLDRLFRADDEDGSLMLLRDAGAGELRRARRRGNGGTEARGADSPSADPAAGHSGDDLRRCHGRPTGGG